MKRLLILLSLAAGCMADGGMAYRGVPPDKELFHYNEKLTYYLYTERVGWEEANSICQSIRGGGTLAVPSDSLKAQFVAQSIAEAWAALEDMWIGGHFVQTSWQWVNGQKLPETSRQAANMSFLYPPWVDGAMPFRKNRHCLAIDRNGHSDPYFIDLDCKLKRPFVCQTASKDNTGGPEPKKTVQIYEYEYILYHGRVDWDQAVAFCRSQGYVLATVFNSSYADRLARAMLKTRPEFEDVWVGGSYKNEKWSWIENSEEIAQDPSAEGANGLVFPPWARVPPRSTGMCLLFDRHLCESPKFIDTACNMKRDFVCARSTKGEAEVIEIPDATTVRSKRYIIHHTPADFTDARAICEDETNPDGPGKLLYIDGGDTKDPYDELAIIMQLMSDNKDELIHVWLAATYDENVKSFKWLYDVPNFEDAEQPDNTQILPVQADEATGYPPWCNNDEPTRDMACLNLDRQNYNTPLYYGLECNVTQDVICVVEAKPRGVERFHVKQQAYQTSDFEQTGQYASWVHARKLCEDETGSMLTDVNVEELSQIVQNLPDGEYYIGAKYAGSPRAAVWTPSMAPVSLPPIKIEAHKAGRDCLVLSVANKKAQKISTVSCEEKTNTSYICSDQCGSEIDEVKDHTWRCNWQEGSGVTEATLGKTCEKRCPINQVLLGAKKVTCTVTGWMSTRLGKSGLCLAPEKAAEHFSTLFANETGEEGLVFIYDGSSTVRSEELDVIKYIIGSTISKLNLPQLASRKRRYINHRNRRSKSKSKSRSRRQNEEGMSVAVFNLNSNSSVEPLLLINPDPCEIVSNLGEEQFVRGAGRRDYSRAFRAAKKYLDTMASQLSVVVISAGPNQADDYREDLHALKGQAHSVITIGVGARFNSDELSEIATADSHRVLNHAAVGDYEVFKEFADAIVGPNKCASQIAPLKSAAAAAVKKIEESRVQGGTVESEPPAEDYSDNNEPPADDGNPQEQVPDEKPPHEQAPAEEPPRGANQENSPNEQSPTAEGESKPEEGEGKPEEGEAKPAEGEANPAEGEAKPAEGEANPAEGVTKPAEGEAKPAEDEAKPAEGEANPAEGEAKPAEGEAPPAEGEAPPAEGEAPPAEGEAPPEAEAAEST